MEKYYKLVGSHKFIGVQPFTLSKANFNKNVRYYLTYKLDGQRHLLLIKNKMIGVLINSKLKINPEVPEYHINSDIDLNGTLLDGEFYEGKFYCFDILFYKGYDIRNLFLTERLKILSSIKSSGIILKKYWSPYDRPANSSIVSECKNFFEIKKKFSKEMKTGEVDGIIFTPDLEYKSVYPVLKWKPEWLLSIDFKIKKKIYIDNVKGPSTRNRSKRSERKSKRSEDFLQNSSKVNVRYVFELLTQNEKIYSDSFKIKTKTGLGFKTVKITGIQDVSKKVYDEYPDHSIIEFIYIKENGKGNGKSKSKSKSKGKGEGKSDLPTGNFIPLRARPDKLKSNHISVIKSNFIQILAPLNVKNLLCNVK